MIRAVSPEPSSAEWGSEGYFSAKLAVSPSSDPFFDYERNALQRRRIVLTARFFAAAVRPGGRILDVGCATGELTHALSRESRARETVAIDFVAEMLDVARQRHPGIRFERVTLPGLPFDDASYDAVACAEVLYYLSPNDRRAFLGECRRVLRPGGTVVIAANSGGGAYLDQREAAREFGISGFRVVASRDAYLGLASWFLRGLRALERRGAGSVTAYRAFHRAAVRSCGTVQLLESVGRAIPLVGRSHSFWALQPFASMEGG